MTAMAGDAPRLCVRPHGYTAEQHIYPRFPSTAPSMVGARIPGPLSYHTSPALSYSSLYEPFLLSHQPFAFQPYSMPSYPSPPIWRYGYSGTVGTPLTWQPNQASTLPRPLYQPIPLRSPSDTSTLRSPSSTSLSSPTSSTPSPAPDLTPEEFLQELQRLRFEGRGGQTPIARFRVQGEPMSISVSRPSQDGPFIMRHYLPDGREDAISTAHILPDQSGIVWYPPPRVQFSRSDI